MLQKPKFFFALVLSALVSETVIAGDAVNSGNNPFIGRWVVAKVLVNGESERRLNIQLNDPTEMWRILTISDKSVQGNLAEINDRCEPYVLEKSSTMVADIEVNDLSQVMGKPSGFRQFDISLPKDKIIDVFRFKCQNNNEYFGKGAFLVEQSDSKGVWFTLIGKQMALRWYDNTIIMLDRLPDRKSINPSFSCSGKLNLTEKAICESDELSGYDKSVDAQYKICARYAQTGVAKNTEMVAYNKKYITGLRSTQKRWIIKRNECGSNIECIKSALLARLSFLQEIDITDPISAFEPEE